MSIFNEYPGNIIEVNMILKQHGFETLRPMVFIDRKRGKENELLFVLL